MSFEWGGGRVELRGNPAMFRMVGDHPVEAELPESLELPVGPVFEPEEVLAWRTGQEKGVEEEELLVKWVGQSVDDASWMSKTSFQSQFPDFNLEDKVVSKEDGVDMEREQGLGWEERPRPLLVYQQRGRA